MMLAGYRFQIRLENMAFGFASISGIQREIETEVYQEGGRNDQILVFPKASVKQQSLILKRGVYEGEQHPFYLVGERINHMDIEILGNDGSSIKKRYTLTNIVIRKWGVSEMGAQENQLLIDTFELDYGDISIT